MIFLLGGRGFYGSGFARQLEARRLPFEVITRENYDRYRGRRCDIFINAAGNSSKVLARQSPLVDFDASVKSVRASLLDFPCDMYVHLSSCDVYPGCGPGDCTGEDATIDPSRVSPYGFHKRLAEQCVQHAAPAWLIVRLGGAVGPGLKKNAIFDILHGGPLWLDPRSRLQFMRTDDAARIVLQLVDRGVGREVFNVCGAGTIALSEALETWGEPVPLQAGSPQAHYEVDLQKLRQFAEIPNSRDTVLEFVRQSKLAASRAA